MQRARNPGAFHAPYEIYEIVMSRMLKALQQIEQHVAVSPAEAAPAAVERQMEHVNRLLERVQHERDAHRPANARSAATPATASGLAMADYDSRWLDFISGVEVRSPASSVEPVLAEMETQADPRTAIDRLAQVSDYVCSDVVPEPDDAECDAPTTPADSADAEPEAEPVPIAYRQLAAGMACQWQLPTVVGLVPVGAAGATPWLVVPLSAAIAAVLDCPVLLAPADQPADDAVTPQDHDYEEPFDLATPYPLVRLLNDRRAPCLARSSAARVADRLRTCRQQYPVTVVLLPDVADPAALRLAAVCDAVYLAVRLGNVSARDVQQAAGRLESCGALVRGCLALDKS